MGVVVVVCGMVLVAACVALEGSIKKATFLDFFFKLVQSVSVGEFVFNNSEL